jgi:hypothetical protein
MSLDLYQYLTAYGSVYATRHKVAQPDAYVKWTEENFQYVRYNPKKPIERYGLSITSLDGGMTGVPDLDSLYEYNSEHNANHSEGDFRTFTPAYQYESLKKVFNPIEPYLFRSHVLKLNPGGFFPPHRDVRGMHFNNYRIIVPLQNMNPPYFTFVVDGSIQQWDHGYAYFVDTAKTHYLFNSSFEPTYMIVFNVDLTIETVEFITEHLRFR